MSKLTKRQKATKLLLQFNYEVMTKKEISNICFMSDSQFKYYFKNNMPEVERWVIEQSEQLQEFYKL